MRPLVSVVIPTYNRGSLLPQAIDSVRKQTYTNLEIIIVDDGSTDDTQARLRQYGSPIRVIVQDNAGPSAARNRGIAAARGEIVAFLDSDDAWLPSKLERQIRLLNLAGDRVPCCLSNANIERPGGGVVTSFEYAMLHATETEGIWTNVTEVLSTRFVMFTQMVAVRRSVLERIGGFDEDLSVMEDYDLALRLSLEGPWAFIRDPLVSYREDSPNSLATAASMDQIRVIDSALRARYRLRDLINASDTHRHLQRTAARSVRMLERERRAVQLADDDRWACAMLGKGVVRVDRAWRSVLRRTPWFPRMCAESLNRAPKGVAVDASAYRVE